MRRRLVELLFDANEEAERALAYGLKQTEDAIKRQMHEITLTPDATFIDPLLGRWTNPGLGTIDMLFETAQQKYWFERVAK